MAIDDTEVQVKLDQLGGVLEIDDLESGFCQPLQELSEDFANIVNGLRSLLHPAWASRQVRLVFVDSSCVNASALKTSSSDYIVIRRGLVEVIYGVMLLIMSSPSIFPEVGDPSAEQEPEATFTTGFPRFPLLRKNSTHGSIAVHRPANIARGAFAIEMAYTALRFALLHELGHIYAGHLELLGSLGLPAHIAEVGALGLSPQPPRLRQVLEVDADTFAAHLGSYTPLHPEAGRSLVRTFHRPGTAPVDAQFVAYGVAIGVLFRLFFTDGPAPTAAPADEYPHPAVRFNLAMGRAVHLGILARRFSVRDFQRLIPLSFWLVEDAWVKFGLLGHRMGSIDAWRKQVADLSADLIAEYGKRADMLRKYTRLPPVWYGNWPQKKKSVSEE